MVLSHTKSHTGDQWFILISILFHTIPESQLRDHRDGLSCVLSRTSIGKFTAFTRMCTWKMLGTIQIRIWRMVSIRFFFSFKLYRSPITFQDLFPPPNSEIFGASIPSGGTISVRLKQLSLKKMTGKLWGTWYCLSTKVFPNFKWLG